MNTKFETIPSFRCFESFSWNQAVASCNAKEFAACHVAPNHLSATAECGATVQHAPIVENANGTRFQFEAPLILDQLNLFS